MIGSTIINRKMRLLGGSGAVPSGGAIAAWSHASQGPQAGAPLRIEGAGPRAQLRTNRAGEYRLWVNPGTYDALAGARRQDLTLR